MSPWERDALQRDSLDDFTRGTLCEKSYDMSDDLSASRIDSRIEIIAAETLLAFFISMPTLAELFSEKYYHGVESLLISRNLILCKTYIVTTSQSSIKNNVSHYKRGYFYKKKDIGYYRYKIK